MKCSSFFKPGLYSCPLDCHSSALHNSSTVSLSRTLPHLLPAWRGVSSNRQPICTTASWDTTLKTKKYSWGHRKTFQGSVLRNM